MENSHIQWTDHTFNPWIGCTKVSPGCLNCYAEVRDQRFAKGIHWGKGAPRQRTSESNWREPLKWNRTSVCEDCGKHTDLPKTVPGVCPKCYGDLRRPRVFCASLADWLDEEVPIEWLAHLLHLIHDTPNLDWLLLTKRPQNFVTRLLSANNWHHDLSNVTSNRDIASWLASWRYGELVPSNVWLGTSVEDQTRADERIPHLLDTPAAVRFLSCEPLLGPVDLKPRPKSDLCIRCGKGPDALHNHPDGYRTRGLDWIICGGESGHGAREMQLTWAAGLRNQCQHAGVAFFMKQLGSNCMMNLVETEGEHFHHFTGPGKGGELDQIPVGLRLREFPKSEVMV